MSKIILGDWVDGGLASLDLERLILTRMLVQANSGGGKSFALRRLFECCAGKVQQIIVDPEGEFASLREKHDFVIVAASGGDALAHPKTAALLALRLLETQASAVLDISELKADARHVFVRLLFEALIDAPKAMRHPVLVALDEAQLFAPESGKGESEALDAVLDVATRGRKRGLCLIAATQRVAMFHKGVAAELKNRMIGGTGFDVDVKRAAFDLGMTAAEALKVLRALEAGQFFAYGPAFRQLEPRQFMVGAVETSHPKVGHKQSAPPKPTAAILALLPKLADLPKEAEEKARTVEALQRELVTTKRELVQAKRAAPAPPAAAAAPLVSKRDLDRIHKDGYALGHVDGVNAATPRGFDAGYKAATAALDGILKGVIQAGTGLLDQIRGATKQLAAARAEQALPAIAIKSGTPPPAPAAPVSASYEQPVPKWAAAPSPQSTPSAPVDGLSSSQQMILNQLGVLEGRGNYPPSRPTLAAFCKVSPTGSGYEKNLGTLRTRGLIDIPQPGLVAFTDAGRAASAPSDNGQSTDEFWKSILNPPMAKLLEVLVAAHPKPLTREQLASGADVSATGSGFEKNVGKLRTLGAAHFPQQGYVALTQSVMP